MIHADARTFLKHYLSRRVTADLQAVVRGMEPQDDLMRAVCRMSRWIDPRRPWKLTPDQSRSVNDNENIRRWMENRTRLRRRHGRRRSGAAWEACDRLTRRINNERQRLRTALLADIRSRWDQEQAVRDIKLQLSGVKIEEVVESKLETRKRTPEHDRLIQAVLTLPGKTLDEEYRRRNAAIDAVAAYCAVEEGRVIRRSASSHGQATAVKREESDPLEQALEAAMVSVYREKRPKVCFLCLGNQELPVKDRIYSFYTPGDLSKHFKRKHLGALKPRQKVDCNVCRMTLEHKMHLQRFVG